MPSACWPGEPLPFSRKVFEAAEEGEELFPRSRGKEVVQIG
jgi:hypothetical protein